MIEEAKDPWLKALISFLFLYGCRISEALKVKPSDFKLEYRKWLAVRIPLSKKKKTTTPVEPSHVLRVNYKKASLKPFIEVLVSYIIERKQHAPITPLWVRDRTTVWMRIKALNKNCSPHFFRHSRLWHLANEGVTAPVLRDWAGWADLRPASAYIQATGQLARKAADKIK